MNPTIYIDNKPLNAIKYYEKNVDGIALIVLLSSEN